jgi:HEAT repeat protein
MLTYYCPNCWGKIEEEIDFCPHCNYPLDDFNKLTYEMKLIHSLNHPIPGRRNIAAQILGNIQSVSALDEFEKILQSADDDYYFLRIILLSVAKIASPRREKIIQIGLENSNILVQDFARELLKKIQNNIAIDEWDRNTS